MGSYNISAGHNPPGKVACGACGLLDESRENRLITKEVIRLLKSYAQKVYDCTCNNGKSQSDVLKKIVEKCNKRSVILDISIHLNSGRNDPKGDQKAAGCEIYCSADIGIKKEVSKQIRKNMVKLGFLDRGTKTTNNLYYLNHTVNKAILVEVCFVDDKDDYEIYKKIGYKKIAEAIAKGIIMEDIDNKTSKKASNESKIKIGKVITKKDPLRLRNKASLMGKIIYRMPKGAKVEVLSEKNKWYKVTYNGRTGYCSSKYIKVFHPDSGWLCILLFCFFLYRDRTSLFLLCTTDTAGDFNFSSFHCFYSDVIISAVSAYDLHNFFVAGRPDQLVIVVVRRARVGFQLKFLSYPQGLLRVIQPSYRGRFWIIFVGMDAER